MGNKEKYERKTRAAQEIRGACFIGTGNFSPRSFSVLGLFGVRSER